MRKICEHFFKYQNIYSPKYWSITRKNAQELNKNPLVCKSENQLRNKNKFCRNVWKYSHQQQIIHNVHFYDLMFNFDYKKNYPKYISEQTNHGVPTNANMLASRSKYIDSSMWILYIRAKT